MAKKFKLVNGDEYISVCHDCAHRPGEAMPLDNFSARTGRAPESNSFCGATGVFLTMFISEGMEEFYDVAHCDKHEKKQEVIEDAT